MHRAFCLLAAAPAAVAASGDAKMQTLHKLLTGETSFRNNAPLKACNIEHNFGANWKADIEAYAKSLPAEQKAVLERQIARAALTRFTTRELGVVCAEGPQLADQVAQEANIAQGKRYLAEHGAEKFEAYVKAEAGNANWSDANARKFIDAVKAAK